jgi:hypothetical protein
MVFPNVKSLWCRLSGSRWINWHIPYHLHHFSLETFSRLAQRCGYRVVRARTVTPNLWSILQVRASRQSPQLGVPSQLWATAVPVGTATEGPSARPTGRVRHVARRLLLALLMVPLALVNRLVDALGWGDSLVVEIVPSGQL